MRREMSIRRLIAVLVLAAATLGAAARARAGGSDPLGSGFPWPPPILPGDPR